MKFCIVGKSCRQIRNSAGKIFVQFPAAPKITLCYILQHILKKGVFAV